MASADAADYDKCLLCLLPNEVLDIILLRAYLSRLTRKSNQQRHRREETNVFSDLVSVNQTWRRQIRRSWFKKKIETELSCYYRETRTRSAIIRNNKRYLSQNFIYREEILRHLHKSGCLNQVQLSEIRSSKTRQQCNEKLVHIIRSFSAVHYSKFIRCLHYTKQHQMADVAANGGAVVKAVVRSPKGEFAEVVLQLNEILNEYRQLKQTSKIKDLLDKLKTDDIELLNCRLEKKNIVAVNLWCRSQKALKELHEMYESNKLNDIMKEFFKGSLTWAEEPRNLLRPFNVDIDSARFKKKVVEYTNRPIFSENLEVSGKRHAVAALVNGGILVLSRWPKSFLIFVDKVQMLLRGERSPNKITDPWDLGVVHSHTNDYCILVTDKKEKCIWEYGNETQWLRNISAPYTLSASNEEVLLLRKLNSSSKLEIYNQQAILTKSILLPEYIENPKHAVRSSAGNYIVSHKCKVSETDASRIWSISEVNSDASVVNQYKANGWSEELNLPCHLAVTSHDDVIVADCENNRVVLLDSKLQWTRILLTSEMHGIHKPWRLYFDDENKQLIVGQLGRKATVFFL